MQSASNTRLIVNLLIGSSSLFENAIKYHAIEITHKIKMILKINIKDIKKHCTYNISYNYRSINRR